MSFISNDIDHRYKLQHNIDKFYEWSNSWQLENAAKKSAALTLGNTNKPLYTINNVSIVNCRSYRDLGIKFDPSLHFSEHIVSLLIICQLLEKHIYHMLDPTLNMLRQSGIRDKMPGHSKD